MSNAPLRVAFWTMCCACTATFVAIGISPDAARFVNTLAGQAELPRVRGPRTPSVDLPLVVLGEERPLVVPAADELSSSRAVPDPYVNDSVVHRDASAWPAQYSPPSVNAIRTASADPALILGPIEPEESSANVQQNVKRQTTELAAVDKSVESVEMHSPHPAAPDKVIPVPQPEEIAAAPVRLTEVYPEPQVNDLQTDVTRLRMTQLERELAEARSVERGKLQELADRELLTIGERLRKFRESYREISPPRESTAPVMVAQADTPEVSQPLVAPVPAFTGTASEPSEAPAHVAQSPASVASIRIVPSADREQRHDVTIQDAPIGDILSHVARELGWPIIVRPEVTGTFSGEFIGADLQQVFAIILKSNELRLDRRGNYLIIGTR